MTQESRILPLSSVTTWSSGGTPNRAIAAYWGGSIPWISAATLKRSKIEDSDQHLTEIGVRAGSKIAPAGATLVLVRGMALHKEVRIGMATRAVSFNQDVKALVPKSGLLPEFLVYALQARSAQILDLVSSAGSGTGVLNTQLLQRLPVWIPAEAEQVAIVAAVESAEAATAKLERLIAKKRAIKQGLMQQLLSGRTRLPGFAESWTETTIGAIATVSRGASPRPIASTRWFDASSRVRWVRIADVNRSDGRTLRATTQALSPDGIARSRFLEPGTLIMSIAATVGIPVITGIPSCIHDGFVALENLKADKRFLLYLLKASESKLREAGQSGSQTNVNSEIVRSLKVRIPGDRVEQEQIASALWDLDELITFLEQLIAKKKGIQQGMMQQLLTGRTRLSVEAAS